MQPLAAMTWEEARDAGERRAAAILPVGAIEAHGPHLPLETDVIIAVAMARSAAERLMARGVATVLLPPLGYTAAGFAQGFAGTIIRGIRCPHRLVLVECHLLEAQRVAPIGGSACGKNHRALESI